MTRDREAVKGDCLARLGAMPREAALAADGIAARLAGQAVRKFVYVPGQIVNLVVG